MSIRKLNQPDKNRVETGSIQFGEDWPGYFLRGDNAGYIAHCIENIEKCIKSVKSPEDKAKLDGISFHLAALVNLQNDIQKNTVLYQEKT